MPVDYIEKIDKVINGLRKKKWSRRPGKNNNQEFVVKQIRNTSIK